MTSEPSLGNAAAGTDKSANIAPATKSNTAAKTSSTKRPARAKAPAKPRGTTPRKSTTAPKARLGTTRKKSSASEPAISDEDIRMRAYFISERRMRAGLEGDSAHDWLEARRQLQDEAKRRA